MNKTYDASANRFHHLYQDVTFEEMNGAWIEQLPEEAGFALDVGAGDGRDAKALALKGWEVLAAESDATLRNKGKQFTTGASVVWLEDKLPDLNNIRKLSQRFNLILVSSVWLEVSPDNRDRAFRILSNLLAPGGLIVIALRNDPNRVASDSSWESDRGEFESYARKHALQVIKAENSPDVIYPSVNWETIVLKLPDDGTGSLPLLRHIIVNDRKSSTYKMGLLRTLVRIADSLPGMVIEREDDFVKIPLGLVGLYWLRQYLPLITQYKLPQMNSSQKCGFAKEAFEQLANTSLFDLRVGSSLTGKTAEVAIRAIRDAVKNITAMPVRYTTWPGSTRQIFKSEFKNQNITNRSVVFDKETLASFGFFYVPTDLWDCFSRYACWLEPAIINEWVDLMRGYGNNTPSFGLYAAFEWEDAKRDTNEIRALVQGKIKEHPVRCVWTGANLQRNKDFHVDHCFPWKSWQNNDLWNLMPATVRANSNKSDRLPAAALMQTSRTRIVEWWEEAFIGHDKENRFLIEASSALPLVGDSKPTVDAIFQGMMIQRSRLKQNQQLTEWLGLG